MSDRAESDRAEMDPIALEITWNGLKSIADECFLTGTAAEVIPVVKVDSRVIGDGTPGPITRDLIARFKKLTRS